MSGAKYRILYHHRIRAEDGQAMHVRELIGALRAEGHDVLECALVPKTEDRQSEPGQNGHAKPKSFWERLSVPRLATEVLEIGYNRTAVRLLRDAVRRHEPDFIYERHALHLHAGLRVAREAGLPLLLEVNSPMCHEMTRLGLLRFPRRARRVEQNVLASADRVFPVSRVLRDWLVRCGAREEACAVIPNAAEPERYGESTRKAGRGLRRELGFSDETFVLGFVGFMRDWHRLEFAVDALARPALATAVLLLVGTGPALESILSRARERGVADRVVSVGAVEHRDVPRHVLAFDAGMIPAINPYASPLKLFDYFVAGVPAIAPDQPNVAELVTHDESGVLFPPDDGPLFGDALEALVSDRERARRIGAEGQRVLLENDWTWRGNARRVIGAFEEVVAR